MTEKLITVLGCLLIGIGCFLAYTLYQGLLDGVLVGKTAASTTTRANSPLGFWFLAGVYGVGAVATALAGWTILRGEKK